jgi:hypothetical protein
MQELGGSVNLDGSRGEVTKLRILACWDYSRRALVASLEGLAERGHEVIYLHYRKPGEEPGSIGIPAQRRRRFWQEFRDADDVLTRVKPDRIVFMGTEGAWSIGTIAAARRRGIPTAVLHHGITGPYNSYLPAQQLVIDLGSPPRSERLPAAKFVVRSLRNDAREMVRALRYLFAAAMSTPQLAAPKHPLLSRQADLYLISSARTGRYHVSVDQLDPSRLLPVGLPEFDDLILGEFSQPQPNHAVLIDTPHTGSYLKRGSISGSTKQQMLARLAGELKDHGWRLTVKLHPLSYGDNWPRPARGLTFVRDTGIRSLLASAEVVLGFGSTLLLPALLRRPGVLLRTPNGSEWLQDLAVEMGAILAPVDFDAVGPRDVLEAKIDQEHTAQGRRRLFEELLGPPDGRSLDRVESALLAMTMR